MCTVAFLMPKTLITAMSSFKRQRHVLFTEYCEADSKSLFIYLLCPVHTVEVEGTFDRVKWAYTLAKKSNSTHLTKSKEHSFDFLATKKIARVERLLIWILMSHVMTNDTVRRHHDLVTKMADNNDVVMAAASTIIVAAAVSCWPMQVIVLGAQLDVAQAAVS